MFRIKIKLVVCFPPSLKKSMASEVGTSHRVWRRGKAAILVTEEKNNGSQEKSHEEEDCKEEDRQEEVQEVIGLSSRRKI